MLFTLHYINNSGSKLILAASREASRTTSEPPRSYELSWLFPLKQGREAESSYELGGSDVVRELSREPAMFQIGL